MISGQSRRWIIVPNAPRQIKSRLLSTNKHFWILVPNLSSREHQFWQPTRSSQLLPAVLRQCSTQIVRSPQFQAFKTRLITSLHYCIFQLWSSHVFNRISRLLTACAFHSHKSACDVEYIRLTPQITMESFQPRPIVFPYDLLPSWIARLNWTIRIHRRYHPICSTISVFSLCTQSSMPLPFKQSLDTLDKDQAFQSSWSQHSQKIARNRMSCGLSTSKVSNLTAIVHWHQADDTNTSTSWAIAMSAALSILKKSPLAYSTTFWQFNTAHNVVRSIEIIAHIVDSSRFPTLQDDTPDRCKQSCSFEQLQSKHLASINRVL